MIICIHLRSLRRQIYARLRLMRKRIILRSGLPDSKRFPHGFMRFAVSQMSMPIPVNPFQPQCLELCVQSVCTILHERKEVSQLRESNRTSNRRPVGRPRSSNVRQIPSRRSPEGLPTFSGPCDSRGSVTRPGCFAGPSTWPSLAAPRTPSRTGRSACQI